MAAVGVDGENLERRRGDAPSRACSDVLLEPSWKREQSSARRATVGACLRLASLACSGLTLPGAVAAALPICTCAALGGRLRARRSSKRVRRERERCGTCQTLSRSSSAHRRTARSRGPRNSGGNTAGSPDARSKRRCGLTGRSIGVATAGCLARVAQLAYPPPRGQGSLPQLSGYLYVRPRRRHGPGSKSCQCASVTLPDLGRLYAAQRAVVVARRCRFCSGALRRQRQRSSSMRPGVSSGGRFAPACCAAQSVCGRAAHGRLGLLCRRRARGARGRQRFGCQCR